VWVDAAAHGHPPITSTNILLGFRAVLGATLGEGLVVEAQGRTAPGRQALLRTPRTSTTRAAEPQDPRGGRQFRMRCQLVGDGSSAMQPQQPFSRWYLSWTSRQR
jgi:hypothetical protein